MRIGPTLRAWKCSVGAWTRSRPSACCSSVTFRPEFEPPWIGRPHVTALTLNRLVQREVSAIVDRVIGNKLLPANIRQDIIERSDGIPLFIEEMTKAVLEAESQGAAEQTVAAIPSSRRAVPGKPTRLVNGPARQAWCS